MANTSYKTEFDESFHAIPEWVRGIDISWHNDACPCFAEPLLDRRLDHGRVLWIDAEKPECREYYPDASRFTLANLHGDILWQGDDETLAKMLWEKILESI